MRRVALVGVGILAAGCAPSVGLDASAHDHARVIAPDAQNEVADASEPASDASVLDSADSPGDASRDPSHDLTVHLVGTSADTGRWFECRLLDDRNRLRSLAVLTGLTSPTESFALYGSVPTTPMRVDTWIDDDGTLAWSPPPLDRAWRDWLVGAGPFVVPVDTALSPADLTAPTNVLAADFVGHMTGFDAHVGFAYELTLRVTATDRQVGLYRTTLPASGTFDVNLRGIVDPGTEYTAFWYIDLDRSGSYNRYGDHSAMLTATALASGLSLSHDHHLGTTTQP